MGNTIKTVKVVVAGDTSGAQGSLDKLAAKSQSTASTIKNHMSGLFSTLNQSGMFGGLMGQIDTLSKSFDGLALKGKSMRDKLAGGGVAVAGVGGALTMASQGDQQAQQQLAQAFSDTGNSIADYKDQVDKTAGSMTKYGDTSAQVDGALQSLVQATGSPKKAFADMGVAADLAAAKHESLGEAADQVAKILSGKGTRSLAEFGINVTKTKGSTTDYQGVLDQLAKKVSGQASAASDTFKGKLEALRAEVENHVAEIGQKYGPAITAAGAAMTVAGAAASGVSSIMNMFRGATETAAAAQDVLTVSQTAGGVAADGLAAGETAADAAGMPLILTIGLIVLAVAAVIAIIYELVTHWHQVFDAIKAVVSDVIDFIKKHWELILEILLAPIAPVLAVFVRFHDQIIGFFADVVHFIASVPGSIVGFFTGLPDKIMGALTGLLDKMVSFGENIITSIVHGVEHMGSAIWDSIKKHIPGSGVIGGALSAIGLAEGGIVTKPTLAMIGEAGYPEAVIPLKGGATVRGFNDAVGDLQSVGGGGQGQQINNGHSFQVEQNIYLPTGTPEEFGDASTWRLARLVA